MHESSLDYQSVTACPSWGFQDYSPRGSVQKCRKGVHTFLRCTSHGHWKDIASHFCFLKSFESRWEPSPKGKLLIHSRDDGRVLLLLEGFRTEAVSSTFLGVVSHVLLKIPWTISRKDVHLQCLCCTDPLLWYRIKTYRRSMPLV